MSKNRHRASIKLDTNEAYVVADAATLRHVAEVYRILSEDAATSEDQAKWIEVADLFDEWIDKTEATLEDEDDQDWEGQALFLWAPAQ